MSYKIPSELYEKIDMLHIKCSKCLDTRVLWKSIHNNKLNNHFMIISCDRCSDCRFLDYSKTSNIKINNIPVFNYDTDETDVYFFTTRIPYLRKKCNITK